MLNFVICVHMDLLIIMSNMYECLLLILFIGILKTFKKITKYYPAFTEYNKDASRNALIFFY